jgi:hypothetical protein
MLWPDKWKIDNMLGKFTAIMTYYTNIREKKKGILVVIQIVIMKDKTQPSVDHTNVNIKNMYYTLHGILNRTEMNHFFIF